jgi:sugar O-acyltransferase (sialic acid O-acetyltransferase NeuD family)
MKKPLYIIGAGSVGGHIAWNFRDYLGSEPYELAGFLDDDEDKIGTEPFGYPVAGTSGMALELDGAAIVIGIAFPGAKKIVIEKISENRSLQFPVLIHPKAWISNDVKPGKGCVIYPGTSVNYGCRIGDFVVMNMNCAVGHHSDIGRYSSLAPGVNLGGHTQIGEAVDMGIGSATLQNVRIGSGAIIGGQAMLIEDVEPGKTVAGVPGKEI